MYRVVLIVVLLLSVAMGSFVFSAAASVKRFALVVGANDGGSTRVKLRYAVSDANSFARVLNDIGGVSHEEASLMYQPDRANLLSAMNEMYIRIVEAKKNNRKVEFIFYYSGHSDEEGLLLGNEKVYYSELKKTIQSMPADVRIAILDSCFSGAFIQMKGGTKKAPFLLDTSYDMKGNAYMSSSSRDEASQESERIRGSFFTHFLVLGLRGAADVTQDKKITLNEAYQFAYRQTLVKTEKTLGGAQHPNYNIQMIGTGDVVLTDIAAGTTSVALEESIEGKILILSKNNLPVAEIDKEYGREVTLSLEEGEYTVIANDGKRVSELKISLTGEQNLRLASDSFARSSLEITAMRGDQKKIETDETGAKPTRETLFTGDVIAYTRNFAKSIDLSWMISLDAKVCRTGDSASLWPGARLGLLVNDRYLLGVAGYALVAPQKRSSINGEEYVGDKAKVEAAYGGFIFEYYFYPDKLINYSAGILVGAGSVSFYSSEKDTPDENDPQDQFFACEPYLMAHVNLAKYVKFDVGVSYKFTNGINSEGRNMNDKGFSGVTGMFSFSVGWF